MCQVAETNQASPRTMKYQLVIQFRGESLADFDALVALEDCLIAELGNSADVDGPDFGSGTANIFIFTTDPALTFWRVRQVLQHEGRLPSVTAAYRDVTGNDYTVIWPKDSPTPFAIL
jgi:hypothetical protein